MLRRFLPSVVEHTALPDCEVVVADNGSTDESLSILGSFSSVRVIRFEQNYGFAEGYNRAIAQTDAEYVVLLNSDVEVQDNWLAPLLNYMDAHPDVAAVQPKILAEQQREPQLFEHAGAAGGYIDLYGYPYCRGRMFSYVEEDNGQYDTPAEVFWTSGACMCVRTAAYKACGGLDAGFFAHMEEIDLCWRMQCRGWRLMCLPQSAVWHVGGGALAYDNPRKTYLNFRNNLLMLYKNLPAAQLRRVLFCRFWMDSMAAVQYLLTGKMAHFRAVCRARRDYRRMRHTETYREQRRENLRLATEPYPPMIAQRSIVWDYYLRGKRQ